MVLRRVVDRSDEQPGADPNPVPAEADSRAATVIRLQQSVGNAAVARYLAPAVQRQPFTFAQPAPQQSAIPAPGSLGQGLDKRRNEIKSLITAFLDKEKDKPPGGRIVNLSLSLAEVTDGVRQNVKESFELAPEDVAEIVRAWGAPHGLIFPHRSPGDRDGVEKELAASVRNMLPAVPKELKLERKGGFITISAGGVEVGVKKGDVELKAETEWGDSIGLSASVGKIHFGAKVELEKGHEGLKWEATIGFPEAESMVSFLGSLPKVFSEANSAIGGLGREIRRGYNPTSEGVKKQMESVKKAMEAVQAISKATEPAFGVKVEGEGPVIKVTATLTFQF